jgi:hypothetical protein
MSVHLFRRRSHRRSLGRARVSDGLWTAADSVAWRDAYRAARQIAAVRSCDGLASGRPFAGADVYSVHADILEERAS